MSKTDTIILIGFFGLVLFVATFTFFFILNEIRKGRKERKEHAGFYHDWKVYCERRDNAFSYRKVKIYPLRKEIKELNEACFYAPKERIKEIEEKMEEKGKNFLEEKNFI